MPRDSIWFYFFRFIVHWMRLSFMKVRTSITLIVAHCTTLYKKTFSKRTFINKGNSNQPLALQSMSSINQELKIADNPTLIVNNKQPVTLVCKFRASRDAILREVVWYREFDDGTNVKILTYDAMMNITQVSLVIKTRLFNK